MASRKRAAAQAARSRDDRRGENHDQPAQRRRLRTLHKEVCLRVLDLGWRLHGEIADADLRLLEDLHALLTDDQ